MIMESFRSVQSQTRGPAMFDAMIVDAAPDGGAVGRPAWLYLPIGLHPLASFCGRGSVERLYGGTLSRAEASLVLLADDLLAYHEILSGGARGVERAFAKARRRSAEIRRHSERARRRHPEVRNNILCSWSELTGRKGFRQVYRRLRQCLRAEEEVAEVFRDAACERADRLAWKLDEETVCWAERYLMEEAAMSLYIAEGLGYWKEIREAAPDSEAADPLSILYGDRRDQIRWLAGRPRVRRRLEFLDLEAGAGERKRA